VKSAKRLERFAKHSNFIVFKSCVEGAVFETVNNDVGS